MFSQQQQKKVKDSQSTAMELVETLPTNSAGLQAAQSSTVESTPALQTLNYTIEQGFSNNCWLACLMTIMLHHTNDFKACASMGLDLLHRIGLNGLDLISHDPRGHLMVVSRTPFRGLQLQDVKKFLPLEQQGLPFSMIKFDSLTIKKMLAEFGPLFIPIRELRKLDPNLLLHAPLFVLTSILLSNHAIVICDAITGKNNEEYIVFFDPAGNNYNAMSMHTFNSILLRSLFTNIFNPLYSEANRHFSTTILYFPKQEAKPSIKPRGNIVFRDGKFLLVSPEQTSNMDLLLHAAQLLDKAEDVENEFLCRGLAQVKPEHLLADVIIQNKPR